jgi:two-component system nitrogen regulation response regulator NtrX
VVLNAAMLEPQSVEIELFGEEGRGSGGNGRRVGLFEQAHGGTLFLDEVADMPLETQGKILRVLVDQNFQRVGGGEKVQVDVRVISSSTRDLRVEIAEKRFREDLYHRLNVVPIQIPSLKVRREDIPMLVDYFMQRSAEMLGLATREVSQDALSALQNYDWPGNVRQLRNIIESLLIMAPGEGDEVIRVDVLPPEISSPTPASLMPDNSAEIMSMPLREAREVFERKYLMAQVGRFGGNISRTAEFIGMERSALHRKLKTLGVHQRGPGEGAAVETAGVVEA